MVTAIFPEPPSVPVPAGTGSSPPEVFPGRREIPQPLREGIQEHAEFAGSTPCPAALSAPSLLPRTVVSRCPQTQLSDHLSAGPVSQQCYSSSQLSCKATAPAPLLAQHPRDKGHRIACCRHRGGRAGFGDRAGKHPPDRQSGYGWVLGIQTGKQAGAQPGEIPSFKEMIQREAIHGAHAPRATGEST